MAGVQDKMQIIQAIFKEAKEKASSNSSFENLNEILLKFPIEFCSVAYEGASMGIATRNIQEKNELINWHNFYQEFGLKHAVQVHVGLGWALSEMQLDVTTYLSKLDAFYQYRVIDGYAYYDGIFKRRQSVRMQQIPEHFNELQKKAYNQGLGRSLWYIAQGEVEKLLHLISIFPENRYPDFWRGIGTAFAYVGGINSTDLNLLIKASNQYLPAFKCGVALVAHSRNNSGSFSADTEKICDLLFNQRSKDIADKLIAIKEESSKIPELMHFDWIKNIESNF